MISDAFSRSLSFVLRWEGGFVDHPNDPGGRTNKGITQRTYDIWRTAQSLEPADVLHIDDDTVHLIYERNYWRPSRCDVLRRKLDLVQFDTAVNMGVGRAVRFLQSACGCEVDGAFGPATLQAATESELEATIASYCDAREAYYRRLAEMRSKLRVFLRGWMNRLNALRAEATGLGLETPVAVDFGDTSYIARVPDIGEDATYDF